MAAASEVRGANKRRVRRRRQDKPALAARLVLDDHVKSDVGIVSEDLYAELFPHLQHAHEDEDHHPPPRPFVHIAIAPWAPTATPEAINWSIVPVTKSSALAPNTVQFAPSSLALQSFAINLKQVAPSRLSSHSSRSGIEILVLDVTAIALDTVFVSLEGELANRLENGEGTFFRDHPPSKGKVTSSAGGATPTPEDRLTAALRTALDTLKVVHTGDMFPLPLPPHPVTHIPPNPGRIALCEPVGQGILAPSTKIIVSRGRIHSKHNRSSAPPMPNTRIGGVTEEDEDTSNDQFYSAAEEGARTDARVEEDGDTETEVEEDEDEEEDALSDDSMDEMISLQAPSLTSAITSGIGTPTTIGGRGRKTNGMSSAVSVFSSFTATTARPDRPRGRLFKAHGLVQPVPPEVLHPKPAPEDDEEARIYVDVRDLPRIGCFSGDWVRVEAAQEPPSNGFGQFGLGSFVDASPDEIQWRPARVYGLPEGYSSRPVARVPSSKQEGRRMSFFESQVQKGGGGTGPGVYASPIFLANLEGPAYLRVAPIQRGGGGRAGIKGKKTTQGVAAVLQPPAAKEVILQHVRTPVAVERDVQTAVMAGLKFWFERRLRVVKGGDLIAVPIDTQLGRTLQEGTMTGGGEGESAVDDVLGLIASRRTDHHSLKYDEVAWFRVGHVSAAKQEVGAETMGEEEEEEEDPWGGVACVDISLAHLEQTGSTTSRIPGIAGSTWRYYLGIDRLPRQPSSHAGSPLVIAPERTAAVSPLRRKLRELMAAATSKPALHLKMPPVAILLVSTQRAIGKAFTASQACADVGLHTFAVDAYDIVNDSGAGGSDVKTAGFLTSRAERAMSCGPDCCALLIRHIEALTADRMVTSIREVLQDARVLIATTTEVEKVPDGIRALFTHELEMTAPDEGEREAILRTILDNQGVALDPEVELGGIALKTAALVAGDLVDVVERALVAQKARLEALSAKASKNEGVPVTVRDVKVAGGPAAQGLTKSDFEVAVEAARKNFADAIGAPKIPNVTWDDVGGLNNVKEAVTETIQLPLERPELFAKGMKKRSGILFYGPPGTGKTLLAKAIATEYSLNFFSVKGPELLNMYIGESEANVRRVFQRARDARPCVVFFDELDSVAPKRGNQGDSGGVMDRIVSQLLAELDGMSGGDEDAGGVFVVGATNRPDLLDQALLRPGRFDKMLYLGVSDTHEKQMKIMEALTRKFTLHPSVSLRNVAERLPFTYTGADFYALCSDAMLKAVTRQAALVDKKVKAINTERQAQNQPEITTAYFFDHFATKEDVAVMVTEQDFLDAHSELIPSVSAGELEHYEKVRATFEGVKDKKETTTQQDQQQNGRLAVGKRSASDRGVVVHRGKGKGKGKAVATGSEEDEFDDGEGVNGGGYRDKGKGKAIDVGGGSGAPFGGQGQDDDEGLYD
ncbi:peroxisomal assembly protein [Podospora pseudoanserina]|uniref:Peroxisomal ATPase PEX6 n=1 Tax=Podospora pseudoanserina TaxID=2609844 RepID=A0ABR0IMP0_9PEZI|nr:peroxisomal assembly protein [Podospora pseudoanserina]